MKKGLLTMIGALLIGTSAFAQLPDGSIAPDFTVTDINGNEHSLYDYLDEGYTVVMDLNATWCGPCWSYHESGALEELWINHGPAGAAGVSANTTDDVIVLMIESESSNTIDQLNGITGTSGSAYADDTYGDWTAGVDFIIVDDASVASAYNLAYFPTIFTICPNRILTESGPLTAAQHYDLAGDCASASEGINAAILSYEGDATSCGGFVDASINIQNMGTENLTSFEVEVFDGTTSIGTENFSGNITQYGVETIDFGTLEISGSTLDFVITTTDANSDDNMLNQEIILATEDTDTEVTVTIVTDAYGSETTWDIKNSNGEVVASGGAYENLTAVGTTDQDPVTTTLAANECHTFTIYDSYGDGINAGYGEGSFTVTDGNGTTLGSGGVFTNEDYVVFKTGSGISSISEEQTASLNIYPNPVNNVANIDFALAETAVVNVSIVNVLGETVRSNAYNLVAGNHQIDFDVTNVTAGVYFIQLDINGQTTAQKITVTK